jgi:hypothetical protein
MRPMNGVGGQRLLLATLRYVRYVLSPSGSAGIGNKGSANKTRPFIELLLSALSELVAAFAVDIAHKCEK